MKALDLRKFAIGMALAAVSFAPVAAQNEQADPHAHDWMNEQVKPKLGTAPTTIAQANTQTNAAQSPAVDTLNQSLGGVDKNYHGAHQWYKDDQVGLIAVAVIAVLVVGGAIVAARTKKKN